MTYEYAVYFRILLLCGYTDELNEYIDKALIEQDPISDIVMDLSLSSNDNKKMFSVLNEYILDVKDTDIDYNGCVFDLVRSFLKKLYNEHTLPMEDLTRLMCQIAINSERTLDDPWCILYNMDILYSEAQLGYYDKDDFQNKFDAFINNGIWFDPDTIQPKPSLFQRLMKKICGKH